MLESTEVFEGFSVSDDCVFGGVKTVAFDGLRKTKRGDADSDGRKLNASNP